MKDANDIVDSNKEEKPVIDESREGFEGYDIHEDRASVEDTAKIIKELSEDHAKADLKNIRYFNFLIVNAIKGLALGVICDSYLYGKEYFVYVYHVVYSAYNAMFTSFDLAIGNPPSADIFISNVKDPELLFIGILILFSCIVFGLWDGWREDRLREFIVKERKNSERVLETSQKLSVVNSTLEKLAVTDYLTGLFNRRYAHRQLAVELARVQRFKEPISILMLDIDHFKQVNDTYGHTIGDTVLSELSSLIAASLREIDTACRYGGEEFLVILPRTTISQGKVVARRILSNVNQKAFMCEGEEIPLTVSIGLTSSEEEFPLNFQDLIRKADMALYKAKSAGRNRLCVFSSSSKDEYTEFFTFQPERRLEELSLKILDLRSTLRETAISSIQSLVNAVGTRDSNLLDHLREVAYHSRLTAIAAGLTEDEVEVVFRGALLHDVGKLGIPDTILNKVEPLNKREWRVLEQHSTMGARILAPLGFLRTESAMIKAHHERHDGLGYPEGLKGDEIPFGAAIIAVADAYTFMTTTQPFREAKSHEEAMDEVQKQSGKQFNPKAVEAFHRYLRNTEKLKRGDPLA